MPPAVRREEIVRKAIEFFAEEGFDSSTRGLARRLDVTQSLLYRYFPSKEDLILEVYDRVYVDRWQADWSTLLTDRSRPLQVRMNRFYELYTDTIFERDWMRIYLFSGLRGVDINLRYMATVRKRILEPIVAEARQEFGFGEAEPTEREIEFSWSMHGGIFYFGIRKLIYDNCGEADLQQMIHDNVAAFLIGLERIFAFRCPAATPRATSPEATARGDRIAVRGR